MSLITLLWKNKEEIEIAYTQEALFEDDLLAYFRGNKLNVTDFCGAYLIYFMYESVFISVPIYHPLYWHLRKYFKKKINMKDDSKSKEQNLYNILKSRE